MPWGGAAAAAVPTVAINASNARMGGGLAYAEELVPRLEVELRERGIESLVLSATGPLSAQLSGVTQCRNVAAVFNVANVSLILARCPQLVAVRDRILVEPPGINPQLSTRRTEARRWALDAALRQSDIWAVPTQAMCQPLIAFANRHHIPVSPIEVIHHGAPVDWRVEPMPARPPLRILNTSYGASQKNIPMLIRAVGRLPDELLASLTLTISPEEGEARFGDCARRWAHGRVQFVGTIERAQLPALYAAHHVVAFPSLVESLGIPLLEGMASARIVVTVDKDWAREVCGPFATYARGDDPGSWAEAILAAASTTPPDQAPVASWLSAWTWAAAANRYAGILAAMVGLSEPHPAPSPAPT
ncbi:MAG TPA: glycosyltransferase [Acidimicrobiales bacterium]|nr:glycosyltransferase [Acidimicrobiales bacterium]